MIVFYPSLDHWAKARKVPFTLDIHLNYDIV